MKFRFVIPLLMFTFTCFSQGKIGRPSLPILDNSNNQPRSFIFLPKKSSLYSSSNFMFNDKKYPSFKVFNEKIIQKSFDAQIGLLSNGGAYLRLEAEKNYINGTVLIHLSTGKVIRCTDKFLREKISNNYISYYYLTKAELIAIMDKDFKLKKIEYSNNGESRVVNASGYYENDLFLKSRESNLLRLELGLTTTENTDKKPSSSNSKISSYNTKTEKNLVTTALDAPRREDYSSYEAWVLRRHIRHKERL